MSMDTRTLTKPGMSARQVKYYADPARTIEIAATVGPAYDPNVHYPARATLRAVAQLDGAALLGIGPATKWRLLIANAMRLETFVIIGGVEYDMSPSMPCVVAEGAVTAEAGFTIPAALPPGVRALQTGPEYAARQLEIEVELGTCDGISAWLSIGELIEGAPNHGGSLMLAITWEAAVKPRF